MPAPRINPDRACSGAPTRGPLRSSEISGLLSGISATNPKRRGPAQCLMSLTSSPDFLRPSLKSFSRSLPARACIRAGISSHNISKRNSDTVYLIIRSHQGLLFYYSRTLTAYLHPTLLCVPICLYRYRLLV